MRLVFNPLPPADGSPTRNRAVRLDRPVLLVGRHPDSDINPLGSAKVSRRHCCVAEASGKVRVRDLGSMNGTWINGKPVRREAPLAVGDVLRVGDAEYRLDVVGAPVDNGSGVISVAPSLAAGPEDPVAAGPAAPADETVTAKDTGSQSVELPALSDEPTRGAGSDSDVVPLSL